METSRFTNAMNSPRSCKHVLTEYAIQGQLSLQVFGNDEIRKRIFEYATSSSCKLSQQTAKTLRLVQKGWPETVSEIFRKASRPLFTNVYNRSSPDGPNPSTPLGEFVLFLRNLPLIEENPYSLSLLPQSFTPNNYDNFRECLINYGQSLVLLDVTFPSSSGMPLIFPQFHLPNLKKITIQFSNVAAHGVDPGNCGNTPALHFLQTVFQATQKLKQVQFKNHATPTHVPIGFERLTIPETVTSLFLDFPLNNDHLKILRQSYLPKLTSLHINVTIPYSDGLINSVLDKYKGQLESLFLRGPTCSRRERVTTLFRFPHMQKLIKLAVASQSWDLEENFHLQENLPKLSDIRIINTTDRMLQKITQSIYPTVTTLSVSIITVNVVGMFPYNHVYSEVPCELTLERAQALHLAFPNLVSLEITLTGNIDEGLKYIFMEMRLLEKLAINLKGGSAVQPAEWELGLIGATPEFIATLEQFPALAPLLLHELEMTRPSIRKLTRLKSLALVEQFDPAIPGEPIITEIAFDYAFLQMPNLRHLLLHGRFSPKAELHRLWKQEKNEDIQSLASGTGNQYQQN